MKPYDFDRAANWVMRHYGDTLPELVNAATISGTLFALHSMSAQCRACVVIPDLYHGYELAYVPPFAQLSPDADVKPASMLAVPGLPPLRVTSMDLDVIGRAVANHMHKTMTEIADIKFDNGAQVVFYPALPSIRATVLKGTGITLLQD